MEMLYILLSIFFLVIVQSFVIFIIKEDIFRFYFVGSIFDVFNLLVDFFRDQFDFLRYQFLINLENLFDIGNIFGEFRINIFIDRESVCEFQVDCQKDFVVIVRSKVFLYIKIFNVRVIIEDINDNFLVFELFFFRFVIFEYSSIGIFYKIYSVIDKDVGINFI